MSGVRADRGGTWAFSILRTKARLLGVRFCLQNNRSIASMTRSSGSGRPEFDRNRSDRAGIEEDGAGPTSESRLSQTFETMESP